MRTSDDQGGGGWIGHGLMVGFCMRDQLELSDCNSWIYLFVNPGEFCNVEVFNMRFKNFKLEFKIRKKY